MKKIKSKNLIIAVVLIAVIVVFLLNYKKIDKQNFNYQKSYLSEINDHNKNPILSAEIKTYNLSLFEFVTAVSKDDKIEDGEYITETGNKESEYLRAPNIKKIESGQIVYEKHSKDALEVSTGDFILYTTRIYNEGNTAGYASKITKTLPIGLEFITTNEQYNGIWNLEEYDQDGRPKITTTWLAKGQGEEINSKEGDSNYSKNLIKGIDEKIDYIEVQVLCRVIEDETNRVLVDYSELTENTDEDGNIMASGELIEEDNQDIERIKIK